MALLVRFIVKRRLVARIEVLNAKIASQQALERAFQEMGALKDQFTARTPLGVPWIEPGDVAPVVVFLASDAARMVSGATYDVTGGDSARNTA